MKTKSVHRITRHWSLVTLFGFIILHSFFILGALGQGTAFTYQGRLNSGAAPATGIFDLRFSIHDAASGGAQQGGLITNTATGVTNGLFTATLDFGNQFPGANRWLEIAVRTNGAALFTTLAPRQALTTTPYAITAGSSSNLLGTLSPTALAGAYSSPVSFTNSGNSFSGTFIGSGAGLTNLNAWQLGGNAGTTPGTHFIGTIDNQPLEARVNNQRALRLEFPTDFYPSVNLIGGYSSNSVGAGTAGAVIAGGGAFFGQENSIGANCDFSAIGGGFDNNIGDNSGFAIIAGGRVNYIGTSAGYGAISGGQANEISTTSAYSTIAGGYDNDIGTMSGSSSIGGGYDNNIGANSSSSTIAGGQLNNIGTNSSYSVIHGGQENSIEASASHSAVGGGNRNKIGMNANSSVIGGGVDNVIISNAYGAVISGGSGNNIRSNSIYSTIGGGAYNVIDAKSFQSTIAGGTGNNVGSNTSYSTIGGGFYNFIKANSFQSTIAGGVGNKIENNSFNSFIGSGSYNTIADNSSQATIAGGANNTVSTYSTSATISGGQNNTIEPSAGYSTIGGGVQNTIQSQASYSAIGGGGNNTIQTNQQFATIPGGSQNTAASYAFAAGSQAKAVHTGSFVWGDSTGSDVVSTANHQFTVRASGGYRLFSNSATNAGVSLAPSGTAWAVISDRNAKKDFAAINAVDILEKLSALPITQWRYNWENGETTPHIGPMAQDFKHAFYPGSDDKSITTLEADGVAFAAIQGLNEKLEAQKAENAELKAQLTELKVLVQQLAEKK